VYFRLDKAIRDFFRRVKVGETPGFRQVRPRHVPFTLCYPAAYLRFEGRRLLRPTSGREQHKRLPNVLARLTEVPPCGFREVAISRDAHGHYHASLVYEAPEAEPEPGQVVAFESHIKRLSVGSTSRGTSHTSGARMVISGTSRAAGQDPLQAGSLPEEVEAVYPPLAGLPAGFRTVASSRIVSVCTKPPNSSRDLSFESMVVIRDRRGAADGHEGT
jgi:hypothetical protein